MSHIVIMKVTSLIFFFSDKTIHEKYGLIKHFKKCIVGINLQLAAVHSEVAFISLKNILNPCI